MPGERVGSVNGVLPASEMPRGSPRSASLAPACSRTLVHVTRCFVAQDERPSGIGEISFASLSRYHRAALVNDGLTTGLLEAWFLEPARIRRLSIGRADSGNALLRWLSAGPDDVVIRRRVVIEGGYCRAPLLHAESVLIRTRLPARSVRLISRVGIGAALAAGNVETRRELLWYGRAPGTLASRAYRIYVGGRPALVVQEDFTR